MVSTDAYECEDDEPDRSPTLREATETTGKTNNVVAFRKKTAPVTSFNGMLAAA